MSMAVAPRHKTKKETAKLARVTQEISVLRNTPEGSFSSQIHLTSTPHTPWRAGSKQQEDQDHHWLSSYLKTALLQNRCLASGLRVPIVQCASSTAWSRTTYSQGFCPVLKKCCASCPQVLPSLIQTVYTLGTGKKTLLANRDYEWHSGCQLLHTGLLIT